MSKDTASAEAQDTEDECGKSKQQKPAKLPPPLLLFGVPVR